MNISENINNKKLVEIAKILTIHYFKNEHSNYPNIDAEIHRIDNLANNINFKVKEKNNFQSTNAEHSAENNLITYYIDKDKDYSLLDSLYSTIPTIIHELLHEVSSEHNGYRFIEEGMVTYLTAKIVRYAISNPIEIEGVDVIKFYEVLKKYDLTNGYTYPCEFVSNLNIIMSSYNIDAQCEYLFHRNGIQTLIKSAETISPDFAKILSNQKNKHPIFSQNFQHEYNYFFKTYTQLDFNYNFDQLTDTDIQMNQILMNVLITSGQIRKYPTLMKRCPNLLEPNLREKLLYIDSDKVSIQSDDETMKKLKESLDSIKYDYKLYDSVPQTGKQFKDLFSLYNKVAGKYSALTLRDFLPIVITFDLAQKNKNINDTYSAATDYYMLIGPSRAEHRILANKIYSYFDYISDLCHNGKTITDILNSYVYKSCCFQRDYSQQNIPSAENLWSYIDEIGNLTKKYFDEEAIILYDTFYQLADTVSIKYFYQKKLYNQEDYSIFIQKIENIFRKCAYPKYMYASGYTPDFIYIKNLSEEIDINADYFTDQIITLLNIIDKNNLHLGDGQNYQAKGDQLDNLGLKINLAYKQLKKKPDSKEFKDFSSLLKSLCLEKDTLVTLMTVPDEELGELVYYNNEFIIQTLTDLFGKETLEKSKTFSSDEFGERD